MEIQEIHLKHFGKFDGQSLRFHPGLNVIYGENETGKSTICSFIRGMLYGINRSRGKAAKTDEYILRQPWENSGYFAGSMRFTSGGKTFYLDRTFTTSEKKASLICEDDGEELDVEQGDLQALLEDVREETYRNTFYFGNYSGQTDEALAEEIRHYLVNASTGQFSEIHVGSALESLRKEAKALEAEKKQIAEELTASLRDIQLKMDYEQQEIESLTEDEREIRARLEILEDVERQSSRLKKQQKDTNDRNSSESEESRLWMMRRWASALLALVGLLIGFTSHSLLLKLPAAGFILLAGICFRYCLLKEQEVADEDADPDDDHAMNDHEMNDNKMGDHEANDSEIADATTEELMRTASNLEWILESKMEREENLEKLREEYEAQFIRKEQQKKLETEIAALHLARKTLQEVTTELYQEYEDRLNERVSQILSMITGGKYDRIMVDEKLQIRIYCEHRMLTLEQVSRGTMEQICFALRIAAGEMLNGGEPLPIILDDAFLTYDDERLKNTLHFLHGLKRQVLIFTCQKREEEMINARE